MLERDPGRAGVAVVEREEAQPLVALSPGSGAARAGRAPSGRVFAE